MSNIYKRLGNYKIGFKYVFGNGNEIKDENIIDYIKSIKIPPAYNNVIIKAKNEKNKILAYGFDSKNRKQILYNPIFIEKQSKKKFNRYMRLRKYIKKIKNKMEYDINKENNDLNKEIAIVLYLIINCGFRIGNEKYLKENNSYGITTLKYNHLKFIKPNKIKIEFVGKKGVINKSECNNLNIYNYLISKKNKDNVFDCNSNDVNNYLKEINKEITSKDLRTWNANELFIKFMKKKDIKVNDAIKMVSIKLHNTANICKKSYIDPLLIKKLDNF